MDSEMTHYRTLRDAGEDEKVVNYVQGMIKPGYKGKFNTSIDGSWCQRIKRETMSEDSGWGWWT